MQFIRGLFGLLLRLFPRDYLEEYSKELQSVFNLSLDDAMKTGRAEVLWVGLRELVGLPKAILYEYLRNPKHGLVAQASIFVKGTYMETTMKIRWADEDSWMATLASLLPLWLLSFAIMAEGFPQPPISPGLAIAVFYLAIAVSIVLLWKGWLEIDIILYSLFPFILLFKFDEISTTYKSPFIMLCTLILSIGIIGVKRSNSVTVRWLILLSLVATTWVLASHAAQSYWQMVSDLGYGCVPLTRGCPPLTGNETPWWMLFFSF